MDPKALVPYDVKLMPLADLKDHPANPRTIRDTALKGLLASIERFGLIEPIIWNRRTGFIVGGHQRKKALEAGGYTEAQVLVVDFDPDQEMMANLSLNNPRIQGEFTDGATDLLMQYEELYPDAARELMLHDLKLDLAEGDGAIDPLSQQPPVYDAESVMEAAFQWFRKTGFPYQTVTRHVAMQQINRLASMTADAAVHTNMASHVADTYNTHRWHGRAAGKRSVYEHFHDDKWLRLALKSEYELGGAVPAGYFGFMNMTAGSQTLANFRPGFAMHLYRRFGKPGGVVLDPCTGYGGRLVGWQASRLGGLYIGTDPNVPTHEANQKMIEDLGFAGAHVLCSPFEDARTEIQRTLMNNGRADKAVVDFSFTSPPYFSKERYSDDDTQSWVRYTKIDSWVEGFLFPMFKINALLLRPGGIFGVNIADVNISGKTVPLEKLTVECGERAGIPLMETLRFDLPHRTGSAADSFTASEPVFLFRKPA